MAKEQRTLGRLGPHKLRVIGSHLRRIRGDASPVAVQGVPAEHVCQPKALLFHMHTTLSANSYLNMLCLPENYVCSSTENPTVVKTSPASNFDVFAGHVLSSVKSWEEVL